jgi:ZIP family zinc transporter
MADTVAGFEEMVLLSAVMGFSIYLSLPVVLSKGISETKTTVLNAVAIGILIFLIGDVFLDAAGSLYNGSLYGYGSSPIYDLVFTLSMGAGFVVLLLAGRRRKMILTPKQLALVIALGIGLQNLTEGLLFGALGVALGLTGATLVVLVGFVFQNLTEGFPIASPLLGQTGGNKTPIVGALFVGGFPTILGGAVGYYYSSTIFDLVFYGVAIGTMIYVILPMLGNLFRRADTSNLSVAYAGVFLGFVLGFVVNLL